MYLFVSCCVLRPHCLPSFFFLFYSYVAHRHLHSFPTRRSSDLWSNRACTTCRSSWSPGRSARTRSTRRFRSGKRTGVYFRSEEHTSELQSRVDLVCRLLLEKKNCRRHSATIYRACSKLTVSRAQ